jgi:predicted nucleotidyltransferase
MKKEFWKEWKKISKLEKDAIISLQKAKKIILQNIPKEAIVSIYVKGSFIRRELNKNSDVDTSTIVKHSKWLKKLMWLQKKYSKSLSPHVDFSGYSLWELKNNQKSLVGKKDRTAPNRAVEHLDTYRLICGKSLNKKDFLQAPHSKRLASMIKTFHSLFLPGYLEGQFSFIQIVKQVFWLIENEQKALGKTPSHSWAGMANSIKDKTHIIHDTAKFRNNLPLDNVKKEKYIKKLKQYIAKLEKTI